MALSAALTQMGRAYGAAMEDPRVAPLLANVDKHDVMGASGDAEFARGDGAGADVVTPPMIDALAQRGSMPLCMSRLHGALKTEHKLKHWGRLQFGLFLKGAGLSLEDHVAFLQVNDSGGDDDTTTRRTDKPNGDRPRDEPTPPDEGSSADAWSGRGSGVGGRAAISILPHLPCGTSDLFLSLRTIAHVVASPSARVFQDV